MTADTFRTVTREGGCADLSPRAKFKLTGADRVRYLNGQVTNDVRRATITSALHACVVNAKGRIEAEVFIHVSSDGEALLLDTHPGLRETLAARLDRYIVADDVALEDVTDDWRILHRFVGEQQQATACDAEPPCVALACSRYGTPGCDLWFPTATIPASAPMVTVTDADLETIRVVRGLPAWPNELNSEAFPQEAGLESHVMDFAKGCYIGQEVLSRIKTTGKMPRVLRRFQAGQCDKPVVPGAKLMQRTPDGEFKEAGAVTSVTQHPLLDRIMGLGYVRQAVETVDSLLLADGDPPRIFGNVDFTPA
jgi:folate-binding protein YgfZ